MEELERLRSITEDAKRGRLRLSRLPRVLTDTTDKAIVSLAAPAEGMALVAVGGYGRREQCIGSDIDLMILYRGSTPDVSSILYPLWDAKFEVGHAVRTVKECVIAARESVETLTALMDARLVGGDPDLFRRLEQEMRGLASSMGGTLRTALAEEELATRRREPYHTLTPDLKSSRGFLRTLHRVHWERRRQALIGSATLREGAEERSARAHFLAVRNALHLVGGGDRLQAEQRKSVASRLEMSISELLASLAAHSRVAEEIAGGVFASEFERRSDPVADAGRRLWWAVRRRSALSEGSEVLQTAVTALNAPGLAALERAHQAGRPDWTAGDVDRLFEIVTGGSAGRRVWDALWRSGWLPRELPEWRGVVGKPQIAPIHSHPVDGHLFRTVDEVLALSESDDVARREALDQLGGPDVAVWAGLFHDIGKGQPGDHSEVGAAMVEDIAARLNLPSGGLLAAAVRHHLLLPEVATRRDIDADDVVGSVAEVVADPQLLRLLYVLAAADGRATGTGAWTPWRASLVDKLYRRVMDRLASVRLRPDRREALAQRLGVEAPALSQHADQMGPGYLERHDEQVLAAHLRLVSPAPEAGATHHELIPGGELATAVIVSRDVPGLAASIAAMCADADISILEGRFEARTDGIAVDTLVITDARGGPVGPARFASAMETLTEIGWRREPLEDAEVQVLEGGSIVEVRGTDRTGFLADVCGTLVRLGHDISLAKLDTRAGRAVDVFYLAPPLTDPHRLEQALRSPPGSPADLP